MRGSMREACLGVLLGLSSSDARASSPCQGTFSTPAEVMACAVERSLEVQAARQELQAVAGRRTTAGVVLPSHPVIAVSFAHRQPGEAPRGPFFNWYVTLTQELEIAGQRGARLDVIDGEAAAQVRRVVVVQQEAMAAALVAYYQCLAAQQEQRLAESIGDIATSLARLATARAAQALLAAVDADVAQAEASRQGLLRLEATRRAQAAQYVLLTLLGDNPLAPTQVSGTWPPELPPLPPSDEAALVDRALTLRGEVAAAQLEHRVREQRVGLLRRARIPNLTLSAYAQRDGLDELVFGGGLTLPLFLPAPLGPSRRGELDEASARAAQAGTTLEQVRRRVRLEVAQALALERAQAAALGLFPAALIQRATTDLRALAQAVAEQKLPLRDALLHQRSLIELLQAELQVHLESALARVDLLRATGLLAKESAR